MKFTKPIGSTADLREIEYISALHQTGQTIRKNGTINSSDISLFLVSRYGIVADADEISNSIMKGFGGGGISEADGDVMDLTEVMAMLLIPTLVRTKRGMMMDDSGGVGATNGGTHHVEDADDLEVNNEVEDADGFEVKRENTQDEPMIDKESSLSQVQTTSSNTNKKLFQYVLRMILADTQSINQSINTSTPPPLTIELLQTIFTFYGEKDVAADTSLLQDMINLARDEGEFLDDAVFAHCCTHDVKLYDTKWEKNLTSTYFDVFETHKSTKKKKKTSSSDAEEELEGGKEDEEEGDEGKVNEVLKTYTFPAIDYAVDTFRSKTYVILLWFTWVLFYMNYIGVVGGTNPELGDLDCGKYDITTPKGFWCRVGQGVVTWLKVMFKLVFLGCFFIIGASIGHSTSPHNPLLVLVSVVFIGLYTFVPLANHTKIFPSSDGLSAEINTMPSEDNYNIFLTCAQFSVGTMLIFFCLQNMLDRMLPRSFLEKHPFLQQVLASGSLFMERSMKQAAGFKINRMIQNALDVHEAAAQDNDSNAKESLYGRALLSYSKISDATEEVGGHWWTWNGLRTGRLFEEEGIWLSNRVMQGNLGQLFLCVLLLPMTLELIDRVYAFYDLTFSLFEIPKPAAWRIILPICVAFFFAEFNCLGLVTAYIPSTIRTTLRFRYGGIGSLHDDEFQKMRKTVEQSTFIFGSMFWGCFLSNVIVLFVAWSLATLACLPEFLPNLLGFISTFIGLGITIMVKTLLLMLARSKFSGQTFYRSSPAVANCISVLLESWNLGISVLFVFIRMVTLVFTAFIYVGRVDIPFLSDSADEVGGYVIDRWPFVFRKDMLQHEAHRHPYIERIGVMYMMKLRYGDRFGNEAGTSWRLLFVYALFPWLRKYRIRGEEADDSDDVSKPIVRRESPRKTAVHDVSIERNTDDTELQKENDKLKSKLKRMQSEIDYMKKCLEEAKTEAGF